MTMCLSFRRFLSPEVEGEERLWRPCQGVMNGRYQAACSHEGDFFHLGKLDI